MHINYIKKLFCLYINLFVGRVQEGLQTARNLLQFWRKTGDYTAFSGGSIASTTDFVSEAQFDENAQLQQQPNSHGTMGSSTLSGTLPLHHFSVAQRLNSSAGGTDALTVPNSAAAALTAPLFTAPLGIMTATTSMPVSSSFTNIHNEAFSGKKLIYSFEVL